MSPLEQLEIAIAELAGKEINQGQKDLWQAIATPEVVKAALDKYKAAQGEAS